VAPTLHVCVQIDRSGFHRAALFDGRFRLFCTILGECLRKSVFLIFHVVNLCGNTVVGLFVEKIILLVRFLLKRLFC
jgi:hypothetical protein